LRGAAARDGAAESSPGSGSRPGDAASPVLVTNPGFRTRPQPAEYPARALEMGQTGSVTLRALVAPDGETRTTRVHRSSGSSLLDQAALAAVQRWQFRAASVGGRPVHAWVEVQVHFRLQ
ncbi:energy transducer TonB, partial [Teichococcus deserti]|uniref:energy transducer TonB n=1 Tax=Teichococcus deserti TaxID=1817963 RepID=UPI00105456F9